MNGRLRLQCFSLHLNKSHFCVHTDAFLYLSFKVETVFSLRLIISIFTVQMAYAAVCSNVQNIQMLARVPLWCTFIEQWWRLMHQSQQNKHTRSPTWDLIDMSFPRRRPQRGKSDTIQLWIPHMYNRCGHFPPLFFSILAKLGGRKRARHGCLRWELLSLRRGKKK